MPGERSPFRAAAGTLAEHVVQIRDRLARGPFGGPGLHLVRAPLIFEILHSVRNDDAPEGAEGEGEFGLEAAAGRRVLVDAVLAEDKHAERVEADVSERELVALMVLAETARAAGSRGHVDVALRDFFRADLGGLLPQVIGKVAGREARRTALADVRDFAAGEQILARRRRQRLRAVGEGFQCRLDEALGARAQAANKDRPRS